MSSEIKNILITLPFLVVLLVLFFWLVRALMPSARSRAADYAQDRFQLAGYETMEQIRRKEYSVIGVGVLVILICLGIMGLLGYWLFAEGISNDLTSRRALNLMLVFIPALILSGMIIAASSSYIRRQRATLEEFRRFKASRDKAIAEYQAKREGKLRGKKETSPQKGKGVPTHKRSSPQESKTSRRKQRGSPPRDRF